MLEVMVPAFLNFDGGYIYNLGRTLLMGIMLIVLYTLAWITAAIWNFAWAWIDDAPRKRYNCFSGLVARLTGAEWSGGTWAWRYAGGAQTDTIHFFPILAVGVAPSVILTLLTFYSFFLTIAICIGAAFGTRFVRRMKKAFDKHVGDKHAHKD